MLAMFAKEGCLTSRRSSFGSDSSIVSALISWRCHGETWKNGVCYHQANWSQRMSLICEACKPGRLMKRRLVMMQYWKSWMYWSYLDMQFFDEWLRKALFFGCFLVVWMQGNDPGISRNVFFCSSIFWEVYLPPFLHFGNWKGIEATVNLYDFSLIPKAEIFSSRGFYYTSISNNCSVKRLRSHFGLL